MNSDGIEARSTYEQTLLIVQNSEPLQKNLVDILKEKSCIVGVNDNSEKLKFSSYIRKAYTDIQDALNGRTKVIMEIVANVPEVKIIYLPNEDNIHNYEDDLKEKTDFILEGMTYAKSETIIIAAKGYDQIVSYRKFLGVIIHEFCHFAVHEIFGNKFKPYYADDKVAAEKWKKLVEQYELSDLIEFPVIEELFNYEESKWVDELVVRYPQVFVEHHGSEYLHKVEEIFMELHSIYVLKVHKEFESEKDKIASLRSVNMKSLLGDEKSKLYVDSLHTKFPIEIVDIRKIVKTNQTYLAMKNIFNNFQRNFNFKSKFMFIEINFLECGKNIKLIEKALKCKKVSNLIIDCHDKSYEDQDIQDHLSRLFNSNLDGHIVLILHDSQIFCPKTEDQVVENESIKFITSDLSFRFKSSLLLDFQGVQGRLNNLSDIFPEDIFFDNLSLNDYVDLVLSKNYFSVGNQQNVNLIDYYVERRFLRKTRADWLESNLEDNNVFHDLIENNNYIVISNESAEGKSTESIRMYQRIKRAYNEHWVVHIDLLVHMKSLFGLNNNPDYIEFFLQTILNIKSPVERKLFKHFCEIGRVFLIFDSFDEIHLSLIETFNRLIADLGTKNKIFIFTRPFAIEWLKGINLQEIKMIELDLLKQFQLVEKILSPRYTNNDLFAKLLENIHEFISSDNNEKKYFNKPFFIKIVTEVIGSVVSADLNNSITVFELLGKFIEQIKNQEVNKESAPDETDRIMFKIALTNNLKDLNQKVSQNFHMSHENIEEALKHLEMFFNYFFNGLPPTNTSTNLLPYLRSGIIFEDGTSYKFFHKIYEVYFIAQFFRNNCVEICANSKNLNMFCLIASNLEQNYHFENLIEFLKGSPQVKKSFSKLKVFKQIFENREYNNEMVDLGAVLNEVCRNEKIFDRKFLNRFSCPIASIEHASLETLAGSGKSSLSYYVSYKNFEERFCTKFFKANEEKSSDLDINFILALTKSLTLVSSHTDKKLIKIFLKLHEKTLDNVKYRKLCSHDFVTGVIKNKCINADGEILKYTKKVLKKFCYLQHISLDDMFAGYHSYFHENVFEQIFDIDQDDHQLTKKSLELLKFFVKSEEVLMKIPFTVLIFQLLEMNRYEAVKNFVEFMNTHFNYENLRNLLFSKHFYLDNLKKLYNFNRSSTNLRFKMYSCNIFQILLLYSLHLDDPVLKLAFNSITVEPFPLNTFSDEVLQKVGEIICQFHIDRDILSLFCKYSINDQTISNFLSSIGSFKQLENLKTFLEVLLEITTENNFVDFFLWKNQTFISKLPNEDHILIVSSILKRCKCFKTEINMKKFCFFLKLNENISDNFIDLYLYDKEIKR